MATLSSWGVHPRMTKLHKILQEHPNFWKQAFKPNNFQNKTREDQAKNRREHPIFFKQAVKLNKETTHYLASWKVKNQTGSSKTRFCHVMAHRTF